VTIGTVGECNEVTGLTVDGCGVGLMTVTRTVGNRIFSETDTRK